MNVGRQRSCILSLILGLLPSLLMGVPAIAADGRQTSVEYGQASYYGPRLHGGRTASGERFDQSKLTAAHRRLPFGTHVLVTNLDTGKRVTVEITDRGPRPRKRIIDLSKAAARQIGLHGTAPVRIEFVSN